MPDRFAFLSGGASAALFAALAASCGSVTAADDDGVPDEDAAALDAGDGAATADAGDSDSGAAPDAPEAPRQRAPQSAADVTSQRPTMRWFEADRAESYEVELCGDPECAEVLATLETEETSVRPAEELEPGVVFWRVRAKNRGGSESSLVWSYFVGRRSADIDTSWKRIYDANRDGLPDVAVGTGEGSFHLFLNEEEDGPPEEPQVTIDQAVDTMANAGDVTGDGYSDLVIGRPLGAENVLFFRGGAEGIDDSPSVITAPTSGDDFGATVAGVGDVNGSGYGDVVLGFGRASDTSYLYLGGPEGLETSPTGDPLLGSAAAGAGDVNGSGYADVITCSSNTARIYHGGPDGLELAETLSNEDDDGFGDACAGAGDLNGDGYADVVVGSSQASAAYVYFGGPDGINPASEIELEGGTDNAVGTAPTYLAAAGDVTGNGFGDLLFGAYNADPGEVRIYAGSSSGIGTEPTSTLTFDSGGNYGRRVLGPGDLDGDGIDDIVASPGQCAGFSVVVNAGASTVPEDRIVEWDDDLLGSCPGQSLSR